jgi:hypothetical protein
VKISGAAEIEDYARLNVIMDKFNTIGEAIAYASVVTNEGVSQAVEELQKTAEGTKDRNVRAKAQSIANRQGDRNRLAKKLAEDSGLHHDEQNLGTLRCLVRFSTLKALISLSFRSEFRKLLPIGAS